MAPATKRLNLSAPTHPEPAAAVASPSSSPPPSSNEDDDDERSEQEAGQTEDESDEEFEIPPGFEAVRGSAALTRDAMLSEDKELWFFKLPKHMDASALANVSFKVGKSSELGAAVASVAHDSKNYQLQVEDAALAQQLVNAFPQAADRKKFTLAKPFTRVFSLVEERSSKTAAAAVATTSKKDVDAPLQAAEPKKSKKHKSSDAADAPKASKKHKVKK